jgi:hypothetical protein
MGTLKGCGKKETDEHIRLRVGEKGQGGVFAVQVHGKVEESKK